MDSIKHNRAGKQAARTLQKANAPTEPIALAQHTPGPWRSAHFPSETECRHCIRGAGDFFATVDCPNEHKAGEMAANARLIAAAPEMLEALQQVSAAMSALGVTESSKPLRDLVRLAIAKATGGKS